MLTHIHTYMSCKYIYYMCVYKCVYIHTTYICIYLYVYAFLCKSISHLDLLQPCSEVFTLLLPLSFLTPVRHLQVSPADGQNCSLVMTLTPAPVFFFLLSFFHQIFIHSQANLVAAFEQSLTLMTARLQTLSVSSEQKV